MAAFRIHHADTEFLGGKTSAKLDVCETLKVPPQLLGIEGSQTYANYEQAGLLLRRCSNTTI